MGLLGVFPRGFAGRIAGKIAGEIASEIAGEIVVGWRQPRSGQSTRVRAVGEALPHRRVQSLSSHSTA